MSKFDEERKIVVFELVFVFEEGEKLPRYLQEIWRLCLVVHHEGTNQRTKLVTAQEFPHNRECCADQVLQVVKKQFTIDGQAAIFDTLWRRIVFRIANVRGKCVLLLLEFGRFSHQPTPPVCHRRARFPALL